MKACSCYTFENHVINRLAWPKVRPWWESKDKLLLSMETIEEWEFINSSLKDEIGNKYNDGHQGLLRSLNTVGSMPNLLINGKVGKQRKRPHVLIAKEYFSGFFVRNKQVSGN